MNNSLNTQANALHWAAFGGHLPCVKYLAAKLGDRKFDLNMQAESCLHRAVEGGSLRVVQYLIDKCGLDPNLQNGVRTGTSSCTTCGLHGTKINLIGAHVPIHLLVLILYCLAIFWCNNVTECQSFLQLYI